MVGVYCSVEGCWSSSGGNLSKHSFPNPQKYIELFRKWVEICGNKRLSEESMTPQKIYRNCRVCRKHFDANDFTGSRLKQTAFPHIDVPIQSGRLSREQTSIGITSSVALTVHANREYIPIHTLSPIASIPHGKERKI